MPLKEGFSNAIPQITGYDIDGGNLNHGFVWCPGNATDKEALSERHSRVSCPFPTMQSPFIDNTLEGNMKQDTVGTFA